MTSGSGPPALSPVARALLESLEEQTKHAWLIFRQQCLMSNRDPAELSAADLELLVPRIAAALARFTSSEKGETFRRRVLGERAAGSPTPEPRKGLFEPEARLGDFAERVFAELRDLTPLAWTILEAHCKRASVDAARLQPAELRAILPSLAKAVERFTSPAKAQEARRRLAALAA